MNTLSASRFALRLGCLAFVLAALPSQAQTRPAIRSAPPIAAPAVPNPGVGGPSGVELTPPQTNSMGAAAAGYGGVAAGGRASMSMTGERYTPQQIAQSFRDADLNQDGELTRAEAQQLAILPYGFDEMDRNRDDVVARSEYQAAFSR